ncbi:hypothetical protein CI1B_60880 [Bradyrhizobium ivorense]|uniref:Uncharacterized protein n=2 Tax=Bradyrhizobium ivorense TaxID=2511166 RepID=A0A508TN00_9BRAD|nr:hypothetical protein CI1B_60880 [Bradyrhizobium ivorense]
MLTAVAGCVVCLGMVVSVEEAVTGKHAHTTRSRPGHAMDALTLFGLFAVTLMLVCYAAEDRSPWFILAFAVACALGSAYGFLQGAWPFGLVEAVWAVVAARRWWLRRAADRVTL